MFLAADRYDEERASRQLDLAVLRWRDCPPSMLLHHGKKCCAIAREWIFATDYMQLHGQDKLTAPRWLRARYKWGPSKWPLSWCEGVEKKTLDCGALSAITREVFEARGVTAYPAQLIQLYSQQSTKHWSVNWKAEDASAEWLMNGLAYHEACAVVIDENLLKIWDPSAACWIDPPHVPGYSSVLALRVQGALAQSGDGLRWGINEILLNQWQQIKLPGDGFRSREQRPEMIEQNIAVEKQGSHMESYRYEASAGGD